MALIYISSTYSDLIDAREAVYRALRKMRHDVIAMEDYVAMDQRPLDKCLADVANCDIYLGIFAWRYGYIPPNQERSITELEFREAVRTGKPCLLFLLHEEAAWPRHLMDRKSKRIEALRTELGRDYLVSFFRTSEELATAVSVAVAGHDLGSPGREAPGPTEAEQVAAALALLGQMPTAEMPERGSLAAGSRMPLGANPVFVGREEELQRLARALQGGQTAAIGQVAAATGLGGIGKTQLAVEFAHRYGPYFAGGVFWVSFAEPEGVATELARCGGAEGLGLYGEESGLSLEEQVKRVRAAWQSALPRLLVFDNCEDEVLLAQWRPTTGGCRVLVTSRRRLWDPALGVELMRLEVLARRESIELLQRLIEERRGEGRRGEAKRRGGGEEELGAIAAELGDLPLALHLAGSYLGALAGEVTAAEYLAELQSEAVLGHESLQGVDLRVSPTNHELHVGRTFALSYEQLRPAEATEALALALLARATYFSPGEPIPRELLLLTIELPDKAARRRANRALKRLGELGLLEEEEGRLVLHRLVARFVREVNRESEAQAAVEAALLAEADRINNAGYPEPLLRWQAHLRWLTEAALEREDERAADLGNELGYHLNMMGDSAGARPYYERALAIKENVLGSEHPSTASSLNNLGMLLYAMGDYAGAQPYLERALAIREKVLGPEHPSTAISLNNLSMLLYAMGDYAGAQPYLERALAIREKVLGPEHPDTATSLNDLGRLLYAMGDYAGAQPYLERALAIKEKVLGPEHPDTATSLNNLGRLLNAMGDYAGARPYLERALAIKENVLGSEHPSTAISLNNLGMLLYAMGDSAGARPYYERALAIKENVLGSEHPSTASSLNNLGMLLYAMGDYAGAQPYLERALAIREKVLGPEHPSTAISLNNLSMLLYAMGDYAGAQPYLERALAIREKVLGPEHPDTATSLNDLGRLLYAMGDYAGAQPYLERALAIKEKVLGPEHPDTATSLNNLGRLLNAMGDYAGAQPYLERALAIREKVLGPEHPDTATSLNDLGMLLYAMGDSAGAQPYLERALAIREKVLGPEHPDTAISLNNLSMLLYAMGDYAGAQPYLERALAIREKVLGPEHPDTATSLNDLGRLLYAMGDYAGAQPYLERALAIKEKVLGPEHPDTATSLNNLGRLLNAMGDYAGARPYLERARAIREKVLGPEHPNTRIVRGNLAGLEKEVGP